MKSIYANYHFKFFDKIVQNKRLEMASIINKFFENFEIFDVLDVGTTSNQDHKSSNLIIKNLKNIKEFKSISNQEITSNFFTKFLKKSIITDFSTNEVVTMSSDLVISNATIEHVGGRENQIKMVENIIRNGKV